MKHEKSKICSEKERKCMFCLRNFSSTNVRRHEKSCPDNPNRNTYRSLCMYCQRSYSQVHEKNRHEKICSKSTNNNEYYEINKKVKYSLRHKAKDQKAGNINNVITDNIKLIIKSSLKAEKITGVADNGGELLFQIKCRNCSIPKLVPAWFANSKFTSKVVEFYE